MASASEVITYPQASTGFGPFRCSRRTAAHLDSTKRRLANLHPGAVLVIIQGCYHTGLGVSEGTHDRDCCLDVRIVGLSWPAAQAFLRASGWAAWWRKPSQGPWADHIHMISLGFAPYGLPVGKFVDGGLSQFGSKVTSSQVDDYFAHAFGLEGMHDPGSDPSWFPPNIAATIFDLEAWTQELEDAMPYRDWPQADKDALVRDIAAAVKGPTAEEIANAVMQAPINNKGTKVKAALELDYRTNPAAPKE